MKMVDLRPPPARRPQTSPRYHRSLRALLRTHRRAREGAVVHLEIGPLYRPGLSDEVLKALQSVEYVPYTAVACSIGSLLVYTPEG